MSTADKQVKLGHKKKVPKQKITERTEIDFNTLVLPDDFDLIKEAIEISESFRKDGNNTFYLKQHNKQWDFAYTDNTLLCLNYSCPGCGQPHTASIDLETAETKQLCTKTHAIFINVKEKKSVQVQMICPEKECGKYHNIVDYPVWKTISDKRCSDCQQKTIAEKEDKRKKSKSSLKGEESMEPATPETNIDEVETASFDFICPHCNKPFATEAVPKDGKCWRCDKHPMLVNPEGKRITKKKLGELYSLDEVAEAIEELVPEEKEELPGSMHLEEFIIIDRDLGPDVKQLVHPLYTAHLFLTTGNNLLSVMNDLHTKIYWGIAEFTKPLPVHIMNYRSKASYKVTAQGISAGPYDKDIPLEFTQLKPENWLTQLFPDFHLEESPRGDKTKKEKKTKQAKKESIPLKKDTGSRDGLPENFPRGKKIKDQKLDQFCTMLINTNKLQETDYQFRDELDPGHVDLLAGSIKSLGRNIESIVVREKGNKYEIIAGHHRVAAAIQAGVKHVKCEVLDAEDVQAVEISIITNFTQKEMNPLEESRALKKYHVLSELSQSDLAKKLGKSESWISSRLSLLEAPKFAQEQLAFGKITVSHIEAVSSLTEKDQEEIINDSASMNLSVRDAERRVKEKKKEIKEAEAYKKALEKLEKYFTDNLEDLQSKRVSHSQIYQKEMIPDHYDLDLGDIINKELKLSEHYGDPLWNWRYNRQKNRDVLAIAEKVGLELIDGEALSRESKTAEKKAQKIFSCKSCSVKSTFLGQYWCPFGYDETKKECKYQGEDEEATKFCYICGSGFSEEDFTRKETRTTIVHMECYFKEMEKYSDRIIWTKCKENCKRSGSCPIQDDLSESANELDFDVALELQKCKHWKSKDEFDAFYFHKWNDRLFELYDEYGANSQAGHDIADVVQYIIEKGMTEQIFLARTPEDQEDLAKMLELLKTELDSLAAKDSSKKEETT